MIRSLLAALLLIAVGPAALAQTAQPSANLTISWTHPTVNTDGSPIPATGAAALVKTQVWITASATPPAAGVAPTAEVTPLGTATVQTVVADYGAKLFVFLKDCNTVNCGVFSVPVSKDMPPAPTPGVPTSVTLTIVLK